MGLFHQKIHFFDSIAICHPQSPAELQKKSVVSLDKTKGMLKGNNEFLKLDPFFENELIRVGG